MSPIIGIMIDIDISIFGSFKSDSCIDLLLLSFYLVSIKISMSVNVMAGLLEMIFDSSSFLLGTRNIKYQ